LGGEIIEKIVEKLILSNFLILARARKEFDKYAENIR
jgi:hypothetical protein